MEDTAKNNPIKVFSCGRIKAAIWSDSKIVNDTLVEVHPIKIDKSYYKDGEGPKYTTTFSAEDLPKVAILAMESYKFLRVRESEQNNSV